MVRQGTPFPFEGPVPADLLIDRQAELQALSRRAADRVNVRLVAPRRFGKTSVLLAHADVLAQAGWRTAHVDLSVVADLADVARRVAAAYAHLDTPWVSAHLGGLLSRIGVSASAAGPAISVGPRPTRIPGDAAEAALLELLDLPKHLWEQDREPTLVVFDEFQDLLKARADLDGVLRSRIQYHQDAAAYVFAGSEPSMMREIFDHRERPLFGQAMALPLGPLRTDVTVDALSARYADEGLRPGVALGLLVAVAEGHPQRTMLLAYLLADALRDGAAPTPELSDIVLDEALTQTNAAHAAVFRECDANERAVLAAIADAVAPTSEHLAAMHRVARSTLSDAAERLAQRGLIFREGRQNQIVDPLLSIWLARR